MSYDVTNIRLLTNADIYDGYHLVHVSRYASLGTLCASALAMYAHNELP